jgi:imidazoleglycerol-phosphate dehydratase/histidinol-phosphatase
MVTNQDGLGTNSFPEESFWPVQNKMISALGNEGIYFKEIHIDRSMPEDNAPTRKPGTEMLKEYLNGEYDLSNSYVIGDRLTDIKLAANLGAKAIAYGNSINPGELKAEGLESTCVFQTGDWIEIYSFLRGGNRTAVVERNTSETKIKVEIDLDGIGNSKIETGLGFFNHMLDQISRHANIDLNITVEGDLEVDEHHTIEDTALALGEAIKIALGDKRGIERHGYALPMDESSAQILIDFGGRPWLVWNAEFNREKVGDMPTEMFMHFFKSFSDAASCNLNIQASGQNEHHKIEAIFKALARALKMAKQRNIFDYQLPSTKGVL